MVSIGGKGAACRPDLSAVSTDSNAHGDTGIDECRTDWHSCNVEANVD